MLLKALLLLYVFLSAATAFAQATTAAPARPASAPAGSSAVHGSVRTRVEAWDWFEPQSGGNSYVFSGSTFRLGVSRTVGVWDWLAEFEAPLLAGLPDDAVAPGVQGQLGLGAAYFAANDQNRTTALLFPKQLFLRWRSTPGATGSTVNSVRTGRFEFNDGAERTPANPVVAAVKRDHVSQRLIGSFAFTHVGRSFDGVEYSLSRKTANVTVVAAVPTRGVFQTDGWGWNRVGIGYAAYSREWTKGRHSSEARLFAIEYVDWRRVQKTDNRPAVTRRNDTGVIRIETFGGHSIHAITSAAGSVDLLVWGAIQSGRWGVLDHRAWSVDVEAGIQPQGPQTVRPWFRAGFTRGSGDVNTDDSKHQTFFQLLPTPRIYARFPFFNMMNIEDAFGSIAVRPDPKVTVSAELHFLRLANANDLWYTGGGVFQPWTFGFAGRAAGGARALANLYDMQADYRINADTTVTGYFGFADGRSITQRIYPQGKNGGFGYVEVTRRF
jgi:hypothetical protein